MNRVAHPTNTATGQQLSKEFVAQEKTMNNLSKMVMSLAAIQSVEAANISGIINVNSLCYQDGSTKITGSDSVNFDCKIGDGWSGDIDPILSIRTTNSFSEPSVKVDLKIDFKSTSGGTWNSECNLSSTYSTSVESSGWTPTLWKTFKSSTGELDCQPATLTYSNVTGTLPNQNMVCALACGTPTPPPSEPEPPPESPSKLEPPPATRDFDSDGKDDILWYNKATGELFLYTSGHGNYSSGNVPVDTGWIAEGVFDYDKDGQADILWWNQQTGEVYVWLGNTQTGSMGFVPDTQWQTCCGGDLDGNGFGDILWFNQTTGELYVWYDNPEQKVPDGGVEPKSGWLPKGVADFDGDGRGDILWWNQQTGELFFWTTSQDHYPSSGVPIATGWMVKGAGDFDGDGTPDILWWNQQTGEIYIWDNGGKGPHHSRGIVPDLNWSPL